MFATSRKAHSLFQPALDVAGRLRLAAAPSFALMACISIAGSPGTMMCSAATAAFVPINDMALMYLLMSLFHLSPWLELVAARQQNPMTQTEGD